MRHILYTLLLISTLAIAGPTVHGDKQSVAKPPPKPWIVNHPRPKAQPAAPTKDTLDEKPWIVNYDYTLRQPQAPRDSVFINRPPQ